MRIRNILWSIFLIVGLSACVGNQKKEGDEKKANRLHLLVGTYTSDGSTSQGIYVYEFDEETAENFIKESVKLANPSYLAITQDEKFVYAVSENDDATDAANALSFDNKTGEIKLLNSLLTYGAAPCYISVDSKGEKVLTANYNGGSISVFSVAENGELEIVEQLIQYSGLSLDEERQEQSHIHCVKFSPNEDALFVTDLGVDEIYRFDTDALGKECLIVPQKESISIKAGSGPRHLVFHPNNKFAYLITELSGDVIAFRYDKSSLEEFQTLKIDSLGAKGSADIQISPDGQFLYASNRLRGDGLAIVKIDNESGQMTHIGYQNTGLHPRNFVITPNGKYLLVACRDSNSIEIYERDEKTGLLTNLKKDIKLDKPVCLKFASCK